jgi:hypothetical protein
MVAANLPGLCVYAKSKEVETTAIKRPKTQLRTLTLSVEGFAVATTGLDNTLNAISWVNFEDGLKRLAADVLPLLEVRGLRLPFQPCA